MDLSKILTELMAQTWFWPAVVGIAAIVFRNNPAIKPIMDALLNIFMPKQATVVPPPVVPPPVHDKLEAVQHYTALCQCCASNPDALKAMADVWPFLNPTKV